MSAGTLVRIAGPTVVARGLEQVAIGEVVLAGEERLLGEVIRIDRDRATLQIYEDTTGLRLFEPAQATGAPLEVQLGPGLLGQVFDGIQRPLAALARIGGDFVGRGAALPAIDPARRFAFEPSVAVGNAIAGGQLLGLAREGRMAHRVLAPPDASGRIASIETGERSVSDAIVTLESGRTLGLAHRWPVRRPRPAARRLPGSMAFLTGQRVLDCFFPVASGGTAIVPGGFGTGKTVLEQSLAKFASADVIVFVGCGERGNEMSELLDEFPRLADPRTGAPLLERTVLIVNTSNMPVAAREASIYTGMTIAEYFRDQALSVALMIDSTSRWAEALREISARLEEMPGEEGYPTYLATRTAQFYERAGRVEPLGGGEGSVTVIGAVSPPGGDFTEPVTQASMRTTGALWALSTDLAHRRHFPAIDWSQSFSLDAARLEHWFGEHMGKDWAAERDRALELLQREQELSEIAQIVGVESLQDGERAVLEAARLLREGFLRQDARSEHDATCPPEKAAPMLRSLLHFYAWMVKAIGAGVPLRAILGAGLDAQFCRLCELAPAETPAASAAFDAAVESAIGRLQKEPSWTS